MDNFKDNTGLKQIQYKSVTFENDLDRGEIKIVLDNFPDMYLENVELFVVTPKEGSGIVILNLYDNDEDKVMMSRVSNEIRTDVLVRNEGLGDSKFQYPVSTGNCFGFTPYQFAAVPSKILAGVTIEIKLSYSLPEVIVI